MKKLIILFSIALLSETMIAQANNSVVVPQAVLTAFTARFPNAQIRDWQEQPQGFIADFKQNGKKLFAYYAADGTWKGTESAIKWTKNLPPAVKEGWKNSSYSAWYVEDIKKIDQPEGPLYALHINNGSTLDSDHADVFHEEYIIFFNEAGQLVRKDKK
ncbi:MAG TPA: PepSY-like domain-containing protein [Puia sp.]|jgi:hypothetical protein